MRSLSSFLNDLPGVRPRKARTLILEGDLLSKDERADIRWRDSSWLDTVLEVGPDAAAAILAAYKEGLLPMKKSAVPIEAPEAQAYLAQGDELRRQIAERTRREQAVKDPSLILENDLTNHRFDRQCLHREHRAGFRNDGASRHHRAQAGHRLLK